MRFSLNGWQRLWAVTTVIMLTLAVAAVVSAWPRAEPGVVSDLALPECKMWRELPAGFFPDKSPAWSEPCHSLQYFLHWNRVNLRGQADYERFLFQIRAKLVAVTAALWCGAMVFLYVAGWSVGWIRRGFSQAT